MAWIVADSFNRPNHQPKPIQSNQPQLVRYAYYNGARHFLITTTKEDTEKVKALFRDILDDAEVRFCVTRRALLRLRWIDLTD